MYHRRAPSVPPVIAALALLVASACGPGGSGAPRPDGPESIQIEPRSGQVGTSVEILAEGFPADVAVDVGLGPPQSEYEVIERTRTDAEGRVRTSVTVPGWAEPGRAYVFVVSAWTDRPGEGARAVSDSFSLVGGDAPP